MVRLDSNIILKALLGDVSECGDIGVIHQYEDKCFLALIDVLGHGNEARKVAIIAEEYLNDNYNQELVDIMKGLHEHLKGSRGAVAALCLLDLESYTLTQVGIGNITVRIFGSKNTRLISRDGIVGYGTIRPLLQSTELLPGDTLVLHSDGIKEHFDTLECAGLMNYDASTIAEGILNKFATKNDDASCIVLKFLK